MKHRSLIAIAAAGALVLAACGDDDDAAEETTAVAETTAAGTDTDAAGPATDAPIAIDGPVTAAAGAATTEAVGPATGATSEAAGVATEAAVATTEAAVATTEAAVATTEAAVATTEAAVATTEAAIATTEAAAPTTEAAAPTTEAAVPTTEAAVATTEAAVATTEAAAPTTEAVIETTEAAVATTEAVIETTEAAVETTEAAAPTTEAVIETTEAVATTEAVVETTEAVATTEAVVETTEAAVETTEAAVETTEAAAPTTEAVIETTEAAAPTTETVTSSTPTGGVSVVAVVASDPDLSTLAEALEQAGITETLEDPEVEFTVFAPLNAGFERIPPAVLSMILDDEGMLDTVLRYHVVAGQTLSATDLVEAGTIEASNGEDLTFAEDGDDVVINGTSTIIGEPIETENGIVYIVDTPLTPPSLASGGSASSSTPMASTAASAPATSAAGDGTDAPDGTATDDSGAGQQAGSLSFPVTPGDDWPTELTFTLTPSQEAGGLIVTAAPLAEALSERLGVEVEPIVPSDFAGVITALTSGQAQIAGGLGPVQMVQAEDDAGADLVLQAERFGSYEYVTQWFTNDPDTYCGDEPVADPETGFLYCNGITADLVATDGPIGEEHLADVAGATVAFVDQGSASGYLVPTLQLIQAGVDPEDYESVFAGGHDSAVQAVYDGDADVGVSFNDARTLLVDQTPDVGEQVVVFAWSFPIPNDGFAVAGDLPEDLKEAITAAFLDIAANDPDVLAEVYDIDGLREVDSSDFDVIRELRTELSDLLE